MFRTSVCLIDRKIASLGLCHGQVPYLFSIVEEEGQTQDELAAHIRVNRAATARTLKSMEKAGLITRQPNPENRRQNLVYPTAKAKGLTDKVLAILDDHNDMMLTEFSTDEKMQLLSLMDRVIDNMDATLKEGCDE